MQSDPLIQCVGKHIFEERKPSKLKEAILKSRSAMRRLSKLVQLTKGVTKCSELFEVSNFYLLEEGIRTMCQPGQSSMKPGLKVALGSLIRKAAKILAADFIINKQGKQAEEVDSFLKVFNLNYGKIFSDAEYTLAERRQRELRKPAALPDESDLHQLKKYLTEEIGKMVQSVPSKKNEYIHLRRCVLTRITLLNGRRGSEAARMTLRDFQERKEWLKNIQLTSEEKELSKKYAITFVMGKGSSLVPVLIPADCEQGINILIDETLRTMAGISEKNEYIFAFTRQSDFGTVGYNEVREVCKSVVIKPVQLLP